MGKRDLGGRRCAIRGADTRNDLYWNTGCARVFCFFAAAPEDQWVTTFEADNVTPGLGFADEKRVDLLLRERVPGSLLGNADQFCIVACERQNGWIDQAVMHDDLRIFDQARSAQR